MSDHVQHSIRTILLADDGSQHAQAAIQMLCDLPLLSDTKVIAVSVFTPLQSSDHESMRLSLAKSKSCLIDRGLSVSSELILGYPAEKIIEHAEMVGPDLIVLGAKGLRATLGILLGGVAQQVIEYANWPVLIVRAPYQPLHKILITADGSEFSERAINYLINFPLPERVEIHVIHVTPPAPQPWQITHSWPPVPEIIQPPIPDSEEITKMLEKQKEEGRMIIDNALEQLQTCQKPLVSALKRGDAATEIIEYIKSQDISLVVMGSRGLSMVRGWLLGSVSRKLVHYSGCSALVVK